jgi:hypothetical protein
MTKTLLIFFLFSANLIMGQDPVEIRTKNANDKSEVVYHTTPKNIVANTIVVLR